METFEITIEKNEMGGEINLERLSFEEVKALKVMLESMTTIMQHESSLKSTISIKKGSARVIANVVEPSKFLANFNSVVTNQSTNSALVEGYRELQNLMSNSNLEFVMKLNGSRGVVTDLLPDLLRNKKLRTKISKKEREISTKFVSGEIRDIGGLDANFHVYDSKGDKHKVSCSKEDAGNIFSNLLYKKVFLSAVSYRNPGYPENLKYFDIYNNEDEFSEFKNFTDNCLQRPLLSSLSFIDDHLTECFIKEDFLKIKKILKIFNNEGWNEAVLKTVLITTKSFKKHRDVSELRDSILKILEKKIGKKLV